MIDYVLKLPSADASFTLARAAGLTQKDGKGNEFLASFTPDYGIFVQGVITQNNPPKPLEGWWVRVRVLADKPIPDVFLRYVTDERPEGLWEIA